MHTVNTSRKNKVVRDRLTVAGVPVATVLRINHNDGRALVDFGDNVPLSEAVAAAGNLVDYATEEGWHPVQVGEAFEAPLPPTISLEARKGHRLSAVDSRSASLIAQGFTYQGTVLSASESAQLKWLGAYNSRDALTYPLLVPSLDNQTFISLADAQAVADVYAAAVNRVQQVLTEGAALKQQIVQAADADALAAIVDNRT